MRLGVRIFIERFMGMAAALGFARPQEPPTEPIERDALPPSELPEPPPLHEQHHTPPTEGQGPHGLS